MASAPTHSSYAKSPVRRARFASLSAPYAQCICLISSEKSQVCIPFCTLLTVNMPDLQWEEPGSHPFLHPWQDAWQAGCCFVRTCQKNEGHLWVWGAMRLFVRVSKMKAIWGCGVRCVCLYVSVKWRPSVGVGCDAFVCMCQQNEGRLWVWGAMRLFVSIICKWVFFNMSVFDWACSKKAVLPVGLSKSKACRFQQVKGL